MSGLAHTPEWTTWNCCPQGSQKSTKLMAQNFCVSFFDFSVHTHFLRKLYYVLSPGYCPGVRRTIISSLTSAITQQLGPGHVIILCMHSVPVFWKSTQSLKAFQLLFLGIYSNLSASINSQSHTPLFKLKKQTETFFSVNVAVFSDTAYSGRQLTWNASGLMKMIAR